MFRSLRKLPRYLRSFGGLPLVKRQLSAANNFAGSAAADNQFALKLLFLGGFSTGVYFIVFTLNRGRAEPKKTKIVLLGSGWAGVNFIRHLKPELYDLSVVSRSNYFLFTPLLPSVTVGTVEIRSVVEPIRNLIHKKHKNSVQFYEGECIDVDVENKTVSCRDDSGIGRA